MIDLLEYLPSFYHNSEYVKSIIAADSIEANLLESYVIDLQNNLYVETATWGLEYFERELGLNVDINKPIQERREAIMAKKRGQGTTTIQQLKNISLAFTGGQIDIIEKSDLYHFIIKFIDVKGIPKNLNDFKSMVDEVKPAHLTYELRFLYNVWKFIQDKKLKWQDVTTHTWESIKIAN